MKCGPCLTVKIRKKYISYAYATRIFGRVLMPYREYKRHALEMMEAAHV